MQGKFAHISDCHIGAWREPRLRNLNDLAFSKAIDLSIKENVDFVVISGDIFDIGIPEMSSVRSAAKKLRELSNHGVQSYVVYGSHDYSPTTVSMVEVLTSAGLFTNVGEFEETIEVVSKKKHIALKSVIDEKTGVRLAGLPARRTGLEKSFYEGLEKKPVSARDQYSVFVFHASISELQSLNIPVEQSISMQELPKGFNYYAGGHLHRRLVGRLDGSPVVYPGPLFGTSTTDLEISAKGEERGFAIVEFEGNKTTRVGFIDIPAPKILSKIFSAEGKSTEEVAKEISEFVSKETMNVDGAIVLLRVKGVLSSGKPSDIEWFRYRVALLKRGALVVNINRMGVLTRESKRLALLGTTNKEEIEAKLLQEYISNFKPQTKELEFLSSTEGVAKSSKLLRALKTEKKEEETKQTFEKRVLKEASLALGVELEEGSSQ
ncbi:MAG: metallophosphoesterase family protein [Nitrososphaerales archaeon]